MIVDPAPFFPLWFSIPIHGRCSRGTGGRTARPFLTWSFGTRSRNEGDLPFRPRSRCTCPRSGSESSWGDFKGIVLPLRSYHDRKYVQGSRSFLPPVVPDPRPWMRFGMHGGRIGGSWIRFHLRFLLLLLPSEGAVCG